MKVSAKTEYACIAVMELAANYGSPEPVRIRNIAERHFVPPRFLVQILLQLKGAGIVASTRGASGGYNLIPRPEEVTLGQVMGIIDGPMQLPKRTFDPTNESEASRILNNVWEVAEYQRQDYLNNITFADLVKRCYPATKEENSQENPPNANQPGAGLSAAGGETSASLVTVTPAMSPIMAITPQTHQS
ncbi:MAG: Rrf2 family transcriptional regulator [Planctomycetaceae bacterium]|nr:Rrf2 family transcriptional regulator [Planctomycetaceae bacterium]